jgi:hypothetical protein
MTVYYEKVGMALGGWKRGSVFKESLPPDVKASKIKSLAGGTNPHNPATSIVRV